MEIQDDVITKIKELLPKAPPNWAFVISGRMKNTPDMVRRISKGQRGMRKGLHRHVLKHLIELIEKEQDTNSKLIARAKSIELLNQISDGKDE